MKKLILMVQLLSISLCALGASQSQAASLPQTKSTESLDELKPWPPHWPPDHDCCYASGSAEQK